MRKALLLIHRYAGLVLAAPLLVVALTGGVLAFHEELDRWLNPQLLSVAVRAEPPLDPFILRERAEAIDPRLRVDRVDFLRPSGEAYVVWAQARERGSDLPYDQLMIDPYSGAALGTRERGQIGFDRLHLVDTLFELHRSLLGGYRGTALVGALALLWTVDCFIGFYLTLPAGRAWRSPAGFWRGWRLAWRVKADAAPARATFDWHRAVGLWLWPMLLVLAWSGVAFNLGSAVYRPVMELFWPMSTYRLPPALAQPLDEPALGWREAHAVGRQLMHRQAAVEGFAVEREDALLLDRERGLYTYVVRASDEWGVEGGTRLDFDADSGALRSFDRPALQPAGDAVTRWLVSLHTATVFGRPMQFLVAAIGLLIPVLALTGVSIWLRRQRTRRLRETARPSPVVPKWRFRDFFATAGNPHGTTAGNPHGTAAGIPPGTSRGDVVPGAGRVSPDAPLGAAWARIGLSRQARQSAGRP